MSVCPLSPLWRVPIRTPGRTVMVDGVRVRMALIRQFGQWYSVARDIRGDERASAGASRDEACESLAKLLKAIRTYYEHQRSA